MKKSNVLEAKQRLFTIKELVEFYGATVWFWRCQIWDRKLRVVKVGRKQFIDRLDIEDFINGHKDFVS